MQELLLEVTVGDRVTRRLMSGDILIGRPGSPGEPPRIDLSPDQAVSRRHCRIALRDDGWAVQDLGSTNGTRLNSRLLEPHEETPLADGDVLDLGEWCAVRVLPMPAPRTEETVDPLGGVGRWEPLPDEQQALLLLSEAMAGKAPVTR